MPDAGKALGPLTGIWHLTSNLCPLRTRQRQHEDLLRARRFESAGGCGDGRARRKHVVNAQDARVLDEARALDEKGLLDAFAPRQGVHPGAMTLRIKSSDETPFIQRQAGPRGERGGENGRLVKASFALALRVQRHGYDARGAAKWLASLRFIEQACETRRHVRLSFKRQHGRAQSSLIPSASTRGGEQLLLTTTTSYVCKLFRRNHRRRERAAFPAHRVQLREDARLAPARATGHSIIRSE